MAISFCNVQARNPTITAVGPQRLLPAAAVQSRGRTRCRCQQQHQLHEHQQQQHQQQQQQQQQHQQPDPGLAAFAALIADKRFTCTQCGKCCTGDGEVWIADEEAGRIAGHLGMPLQRFYQQYTKEYSKVEGFRLLKTKHNQARDCIFLQPDNTCSIHKVRPLQCSTYPWWPDLMNQQDWVWERDNVCEGFDHPDAPQTDMQDAARQLRAATAMEYRRMLARKPSKKQQKQQTAAAAAALSGWPQPLPAGMLPQQESEAGSIPHGVQQAHSDTQQQQQHPSLQQGGNSGQQQPQQQATEGLPPGAPGAAEHQEGSRTARTWQQRLSRLQQLASTSQDAPPAL